MTSCRLHLNAYSPDPQAYIHTGRIMSKVTTCHCHRNVMALSVIKFWEAISLCLFLKQIKSRMYSIHLLTSGNLLESERIPFFSWWLIRPCDGCPSLLTIVYGKGPCTAKGPLRENFDYYPSSSSYCQP